MEQTAGSGFLQRIAAALGPAPVARFERFATSELEGAHRKQRKLQSGILEFLATTTLNAWSTETAEFEAEQLAQAAALSRATGTAWPAANDEATPWGHIRQAMRCSIDPIAYSNWFDRTRFGGVDAAGVLAVHVPTAEDAAFLRDEYQSTVDAIAQGLASGITAVAFQPMPPGSPDPPQIDDGGEPLCPRCGFTLSHFAGNGEHGLVCQTPGCDLEAIEMEDDPGAELTGGAAQLLN